MPLNAVKCIKINSLNWVIERKKKKEKEYFMHCKLVIMNDETQTGLTINSMDFVTYRR